MSANPQGCRPAAYARCRLEQTVLYRLVQQHLETYLALACEGNWDGHAVPGYVERELRRYLEFGILAYGFARARCPECGHDFLVAFSCKGRGVCPSCNARRMAETAAHLVDHVFPPLPVRQWVLSVPKRLRWYLERDPKAVTAVLHIFLRVVEAHLRGSCPGASARARFGAVSFVHRFGASLNRHLHYHCCILDGVFDPLQAGGVQFRQASAPTPEAVAVIEQQVRRRVLHWFSRHGLLDPDDARDRLAWANGGSSLRELFRRTYVLMDAASVRCPCGCGRRLTKHEWPHVAVSDHRLDARPKESAMGRSTTLCRHWCFAGRGPQSSGQQALAVAMRSLYCPRNFRSTWSWNWRTPGSSWTISPIPSPRPNGRGWRQNTADNLLPMPTLWLASVVSPCAKP